MDALFQVDAWDVPFVAAGVTRADGVIATRGDVSTAVRLASVSKPVTALATLVAAEEGVVDLDGHVGPPGSTLRHLLAHASGLPFEGLVPIAPPGRRRIYSNEGFEVIGEHVGRSAAMPFASYVHEAVCVPLGLGLDPEGHPGAGMHASLDDVLALGRELLAPRLIAAETHAEMVRVQFPGLDGVLPDFGRFTPLDWGLGVELKDGEVRALDRNARRHRRRSATSAAAAPSSGSIQRSESPPPCSPTRPFGPWAKEAWPALGDAIVAELR